jgi:hypothetical protein
VQAKLTATVAGIEGQLTAVVADLQRTFPGVDFAPLETAFEGVLDEAFARVERIKDQLRRRE